MESNKPTASAGSNTGSSQLSDQSLPEMAVDPVKASATPFKNESGNSGALPRRKKPKSGKTAYQQSTAKR